MHWKTARYWSVPHDSDVNVILDMYIYIYVIWYLDACQSDNTWKVDVLLYAWASWDRMLSPSNAFKAMSWFFNTLAALAWARNCPQHSHCLKMLSCIAFLRFACQIFEEQLETQVFHRTPRPLHSSCKQVRLWTTAFQQYNFVLHPCQTSRSRDGFRGIFPWRISPGPPVTIHGTPRCTKNVLRIVPHTQGLPFEFVIWDELNGFIMGLTFQHGQHDFRFEDNVGLWPQTIP